MVSGFWFQKDSKWKVQTRNQKLETRNHKPETTNQKPQQENAMRRGVVTSITQVLMIVAMLAPFGASSKTIKGRPLDPLSPGPFAVGVATTVFIDNTRIDNVTK